MWVLWWKINNNNKKNNKYNKCLLLNGVQPLTIGILGETGKILPSTNKKFYTSGGMDENMIQPKLLNFYSNTIFTEQMLAMTSPIALLCHPE